MRTAVRTTVSRDPALVALLDRRDDYPGPSATLDAADRAWLRSNGVDVPEREEPVPLHEAARIARKTRQNQASERKRTRPRR